MSFQNPLLLPALLVLPLAWIGRGIAERRRMRYAVRFTNVEVLAGVAAVRSRLRFVAPTLLALALATLLVAVARPQVSALVPSDRAAVILVLDVSGSMHAQDVKPTRLAAAQRAIDTFLDRVPARVRVGLILFAGVPVVTTPPTSDHELVREAVASAGDVNPFGGTAIGDALARAVELGREVAGTSVGGSGGKVVLGVRRLLAVARTAPRHSLVSILFLSDGHQNRGTLQPLQGARRAKAAGFPVYTVALGTTGRTTLRGQGFGFGLGANGSGFGGNELAPDPVTLRQIATTTRGEFFRARTAGDVQQAYARLGSRLGRAPGREEVTADFVVGAAVLLLLAGLASAVWAPRLP